MANEWPRALAVCLRLWPTRLLRLRTAFSPLACLALLPSFPAPRSTGCIDGMCAALLPSVGRVAQHSTVSGVSGVVVFVPGRFPTVPLLLYVTAGRDGPGRNSFGRMGSLAGSPYKAVRTRLHPIVVGSFDARLAAA